MAKSNSETEVQSDHENHKKIKNSEDPDNGEDRSHRSDVADTANQITFSPHKSKKVSQGSQKAKRTHVSSSSSDDVSKYSHRGFLDTNRVSKRDTHSHRSRSKTRSRSIKHHKRNYRSRSHSTHRRIRSPSRDRSVIYHKHRGRSSHRRSRSKAHRSRSRSHVKSFANTKQFPSQSSHSFHGDDDAYYHGYQQNNEDFNQHSEYAGVQDDHSAGWIQGSVAGSCFEQPYDEDYHNYDNYDYDTGYDNYPTNSTNGYVDTNPNDNDDNIMVEDTNISLSNDIPNDIPNALSESDAFEVLDLGFKDRIRLVSNILQDEIPLPTLPVSSLRPQYTQSSLPVSNKAVFHRLPPSSNFVKAFNEFESKIPFKTSGKSLLGTFPECSRKFNFYQPNNPVWADCCDHTKNRGFSELLVKNPNFVGLVNSATLDKLEKASRIPLDILSYMDWFLAAAQKVTSNIIPNLEVTDSTQSATASFENIAESVQALRELHLSLATMVNDSIVATVHSAGLISLVKKDAVLSKIDNSVPNTSINNLRASSILGPEMFSQAQVDLAFKERSEADTNKSAKAQHKVAKDMTNAITSLFKTSVPRGGSNNNPRFPTNNSNFGMNRTVNMGRGRGRGKMNMFAGISGNKPGANFGKFARKPNQSSSTNKPYMGSRQAGRGRGRGSFRNK